MRYYPFVGQQAFEATATKSEAWDISTGEAVVLVVGYWGAKPIEKLVVDRD